MVPLLVFLTGTAGTLIGANGTTENHSCWSPSGCSRRPHLPKIKAGERRILWTSGMRQALRILHFNDVYNAEESESEVCGGAARFATGLKSVRAEDPESTLVLFSGDALSPSLISSTTSGAHMVPILNEFGIDCAVIGNHEFDFGVDNMLECIQHSNFPWLNSNCYEHATMAPLGNLPPFAVMERAGLRIGLLGLVEPDWVETLAMVDEGDIFVKDFCLEGRRLAKLLKRHHGCQLVIALTHMRWPNDRILANKVPEIDLILGGHDHNDGFERVASVNGEERIVIKSGTDFRQFKLVTIEYDTEKRSLCEVRDRDYFISKTSFEPDQTVVAMVAQSYSKIEQRLARVLGHVEVEMDGRFDSIRGQETNLGNFLCDVAATSVDADCVVMNSGSLRIDECIPAGPFTLKTVGRILPKIEPIVVLELAGEQLLEMLENSVSQVPKLEGRFLQVSGLKFAYRKCRAPGSRIDPDTVLVNKLPLDLKQKYSVAMNQYVASGKDGYDVLLNKRVLLDDEAGVPLSTTVVNYFRTISVLNGWAKEVTHHRQHLIPVSRQQVLTGALSSVMAAESTTKPPLPAEAVTKLANLMQKFTHDVETPHKDPRQLWDRLRKNVDTKDKKRCEVRPKVEGRIICLD